MTVALHDVSVTNGEWLANARRRAGFPTQADLAKAIKVGRGAVGNWETTGRPSMANAEKLAVALKRPRAEVLARYNYPIGGGDPDAVVAGMTSLPPEWLNAIRGEIAAGVADGIAQVMEQLRREGLLPGPDRPPRGRPRPLQP